MKYPEEFLQYFLEIIKVNENDESSDDNLMLSYPKLIAIYDIFMQCPPRLRSDLNNSDLVRNSIEFKKESQQGKNTKINKLLRYVHYRIEEKFKDFRMAFRCIDNNYDGALSFKEFVEGLERISVKFSLDDYKKIFNHIDYDNSGQIDFRKFCLLNTDKLKSNNSWFTN